MVALVVILSLIAGYYREQWHLSERRYHYLYYHLTDESPAP